MRWRHFFVWPVCILLGQTSPILSQGNNQPNTQIMEIAGHNLEYWIGQIPSKDSSRSETALRMILLFGPDRAYQAVPVIIDRLKKHNPPSSRVDVSICVNGAIALGVILGNYKEADHKTINAAVLVLKRFPFWTANR